MENEKIFVEVKISENSDYPNLRAHADLTLQLEGSEFIKIIGFSIWEGKKSDRPSITPPIIKDSLMCRASDNLWKKITAKIRNEYLKKLNS